VGGGPLLQPGLVTLAHRGVLFLDELAEFDRNVLDALRQPLEDGTVEIARAHGHVRYPARLQLIAAMNPCRCGWFGEQAATCRCRPGEPARYQRRVSGPLLDRIDLRVDVPRVASRDRRASVSAEASASVRARVECAREAQLRRLRGTRAYANAHMAARDVRRLCTVERDGIVLLDRAYDRLRLSARGCDRVVKVARTIADLEGAETITGRHIAESLSYRVRGAGAG